MSQIRALIVDDDAVFRMVLQQMLLQAGAQAVDEACDGVEALHQVEAADAPYDLIVCDLQMPRMDGVGLIRALGQRGFRGGLIVSSGVDQTVLETVENLGKMQGIQVLGTLGKPLREDALGDLLQELGEDAKKSAPDAFTRQDLLDAIACGTIVPFYQPQIDLASGDAIGVEVLARVFDAQGRPGSPEPMIACAEREELIDLVTAVIMEQAMEDLAAWRERGIVLKASVNISPFSLSDLRLPDMLASTAEEAGMDTASITIEVTENRLLEYAVDSLDVLSRMRLKNFRLSIDDFGTGATSIEQLKLFPFTEVKVDRSFIQACLDDEFARATVESSVRLARIVGLEIVAEGIETQAHLDFVRHLGVDRAQGYFIARPMPAGALQDWATSRRLRLTG